MFEIALNTSKKTEFGILGNSILPNFAHKCALLNLPSYDTTLGFVVKFKSDFKQFKRHCALLLNSIKCQSKTTMRKLRKIALSVFSIDSLLCVYKQGFKKYLKNIFSGSFSLQSNNAESLNCVNIKQFYSSLKTVIALSKINSSLQRFIIARNERYFQPHTLCKLF